MSRKDSWPEKAVAILVEAFRQGKSASETAISLQSHGYHYTRNAVIGVWHRRGLTRDKTLPPAAPLEQPKAAPAPVKRPTAPRPPDTTITPPDTGVPLLAAGASGCRWPLPNGKLPSTHCCGRPVAGHASSYCETHHARAYTVRHRVATDL